MPITFTLTKPPPPPPPGAPATFTSIAGMSPQPGPNGGNGLLGTNTRVIYVSDGGTVIYDVDANSWSTGPNRPTLSQLSDGTTHPSGDYYHGMGTSPNELNMLRYNDATDDWTTLASITSLTGGNRYYGMGISYGGSDNDIYAFGGVVGNFATNNIYKYDISTDSWSDTGANLTISTDYGSATPLQDGRIFVAGYRSTDKAWIYNPDTNSVQEVASLPFVNASNNGGRLTTLQNGNPYLVGISSTTNRSQLAYEYIVASDTWVQRTNVPVQMSRTYGSSVLVVLPDGKVILGQGSGMYISTSNL